MNTGTKRRFTSVWQRLKGRTQREEDTQLDDPDRFSVRNVDSADGARALLRQRTTGRPQTPAACRLRHNRL